MRSRTAFVITGDHGSPASIPCSSQRSAARRRPAQGGREGQHHRVDGGAARDGGGDEGTRLEGPRRPGGGALRGSGADEIQGPLPGGGAQGAGRTRRVPGAPLFLEPAEGYYLSDGFEENAFLVGTTRRGAHGFLPTEPRMFMGLIVAGSGVRASVPLPSVRHIRHRAHRGPTSVSPCRTSTAFPSWGCWTPRGRRGPTERSRRLGARTSALFRVGLLEGGAESLLHGRMRSLAFPLAQRGQGLPGSHLAEGANRALTHAPVGVVEKRQAQERHVARVGGRSPRPGLDSTANNT